jgi:hypothetical protein
MPSVLQAGETGGEVGVGWVCAASDVIYLGFVPRGHRRAMLTFLAKIKILGGPAQANGHAFLSASRTGLSSAVLRN